MTGYSILRFFRRCDYCYWRKSVWFLMSGDAEACDKCVPRGCSCNEHPTDDTWDGKGDYLGEWMQDKDDQGRYYPCCEWWEFD